MFVVELGSLERILPDRSPLNSEASTKNRETAKNGGYLPAILPFFARNIRRLEQ